MQNSTVLMDENLQQLQAIINQQRAKIFELEYVIEQLPGSIYWKDKAGVYLGRNNYNMQKMHTANLEKYWIKDAVLGKTDYDFFPKETAALYRKHDLQVIETEQELSIEEPITLPNGKTMVQLSSKRPLYNAEGEVVGIIGNTVDISHTKAIEQELRQAKQLADQANIIKTEFMRNMEHDIRTPFNGVLGLTNCLKDLEQDSAKQEYLTNIAECAQELLDYCNSILDFSKIEAGMLAVVNKKFKFKHLIDATLKIELPAAICKKLALKLNYAANIPDVLIGDYYRLQRILINLISNAIKFTTAGHVELKVSLLQKNPKSVLLRFIVADTGTGIAVASQEYIFEKFSRLTLSNKGNYKGIGLGLKIVKQFMRELDGEIDLISTPGIGTQFICTIPFDLPLTTDFVTE